MADNVKYIACELLAAHIGSSVSELGSPTTQDTPTYTTVGRRDGVPRDYTVVAISRGGQLGMATNTLTATNLATTLNTRNFVRLSWAACADAAGYAIFRDTDGIIGRIGPGDPRTFDDVGQTGDGTDLPTVAPSRVSVGQEDNDMVQDFPSVNVCPESFRFESWMSPEEITDVSLPDMAVLDVGRWIGRITIKLACKDKSQRRAMEASIIDSFFQNGKPWLTLTTEPLTLSQSITTISADIVYQFSEATWHEEMVFEKKRWSHLTVDVSFPALVQIPDVFDIVDIGLGIPGYSFEELGHLLHHSLEADYDPYKAVVFSVNENGDITTSEP